MLRWWAMVWERGAKIGRFARLNLLGFSLIIVLIGAGTATSRLSNVQIAGLIGLALAYHVFAAVLNDVIDLSVDRSAVQRDADPLVRGMILRRHALAIALLGVPVAFAIIGALGSSGWGYTVLTVSCAAMVVYNIWGKRTRFPPLTDAVQGLAWLALVLAGLFAVGGEPTRLTAALCAYVMVFVVMINGVHGTLRDLVNDLRCGMQTTAILFGVRPIGRTRLRIPARFTVYALTLQALLTLSTLLPLLLGWLDYPRGGWAMTLTSMLVLNALSWLLVAMGAVRSGESSTIYWACFAHLYISLLAPIVLFGAHVDRRLLVALLGGVLLSNRWVYRLIGWSFHRHSPGRVEHTPSGRA